MAKELRVRLTAKRWRVLLAGLMAWDLPLSDRAVCRLVGVKAEVER